MDGADIVGAEPLYLKTVDAPTANGREPQEGDFQWVMDTQLEDGRRLFLTYGKAFHDNFRKMLLQEIADDVSEMNTTQLLEGAEPCNDCGQDWCGVSCRRWLRLQEFQKNRLGLKEVS